MELVSARATDQEALFALHEELFRSHIEQIWGWDDEWQRANFRKEWDNAPPEIILLDGNKAGCVQVRKEADHLYILNLALHPRFQGQGAGTAVVRTIQQRAAALNLPVRLSVFRTNPRVAGFYQKEGFEVEEETVTECRMRWKARK
jgi:ribosomal protein S18 acetylase RimI-like enzyme